MGSLKDVVVGREVVETAGGNFSVGPLRASDVLGIYITYRAGVQALFDSYQANNSSVDDVFIALLVDLPEMGAEIIARAAGCNDDEGLAIARSLDFGAQLSALEKIGNLTVSSVGGLGNLVALVERVAGAVNSQVPSSPPQDSSKTSENNAPSFSEPGITTHGNTPSG